MQILPSRFQILQFFLGLHQFHQPFHICRSQLCGAMSNTVFLQSAYNIQKCFFPFFFRFQRNTGIEDRGYFFLLFNNLAGFNSPSEYCLYNISATVWYSGFVKSSGLIY